MQKLSLIHDHRLVTKWAFATFFACLMKGVIDELALGKVEFFRAYICRIKKPMLYLSFLNQIH